MGSWTLPKLLAAVWECASGQTLHCCQERWTLGLVILPRTYQIRPILSPNCYGNTRITDRIMLFVWIQAVGVGANRSVFHAQPMEDVRLASVHPCLATAHQRDLTASTKVNEHSSSTALFQPPTSAFARLLPSFLMIPCLPVRGGRS